MNIPQLYDPNSVIDNMVYSLYESAGFLEKEHSEGAVVVDCTQPAMGMSTFYKMYQEYFMNGVVFVNYLSRLLTAIMNDNVDILRAIRIEYGFKSRSFSLKCVAKLDNPTGKMPIYELDFSEEIKYESSSEITSITKHDSIDDANQSGYKFVCLENNGVPLFDFPSSVLIELSDNTVLILKEINAFLNHYKDLSHLWLVGFYGQQEEIMKSKRKDESIKDYIANNGLPIREVSRTYFEFGRVHSTTEINPARELDEYKLINKIYGNNTLSEIEILSYIEARMLLDNVANTAYTMNNFKL